jgi:uncharacterized protein YpiB (UPF0302 family)
LQALNVRLKVDDTAMPPERRAALERPYAAYKFPKYSKDEHVEKLLERIKNRNIKDPFITGEVGSVTFYENVEKTDFLNYLLKRYHLYMTSPQSRHFQVY